ncbi:hypothetical protein [Chitinophaga sp. HK235]|uniref:hypothetical protein n=1 Tax=Chitinophaga sp. HK235 TaxID=2952571 RepID=UPI001BA9DCE3|nr:hypothetical protein [Chitinophaga sp. HK235]
MTEKRKLAGQPEGEQLQTQREETGEFKQTEETSNYDVSKDDDQLDKQEEQGDEEDEEDEEELEFDEEMDDEDEEDEDEDEENS